MPRVIAASTLDLHFVDVGFGTLGAETHVTGHHSATPPDRSLEEAINYVRRFHREHKAKGWGGLGYHYVIARNGTILCGRPVVMKGAHVGAHNSNNVGVMCIGTTGDKPTRRQMRSLRWLLLNAHTAKFPRPHRTDRQLSRAELFGHNDWPGHESNACPGTHKRFFKTGGKKR